MASTNSAILSWLSSTPSPLSSAPTSPSTNPSTPTEKNLTSLITTNLTNLNTLLSAHHDQQSPSVLRAWRVVQYAQRVQREVDEDVDLEEMALRTRWAMGAVRGVFGRLADLHTDGAGEGEGKSNAKVEVEREVEVEEDEFTDDDSDGGIILPLPLHTTISISEEERARRCSEALWEEVYAAAEESRREAARAEELLMGEDGVECDFVGCEEFCGLVGVRMARELVGGVDW